KFTARHPNLIALEVSSFKCGHDAPIYSVVQDIVERSGTPYFAFKDLDENRAAGAIAIRVETMDYFLRRYLEGAEGSEGTEVHTKERSERRTNEGCAGATRGNAGVGPSGPSFGLRCLRFFV
ncbi:MAG TPA: hypothetical protein VLD67_17035, partial [Vicinamibacterales bacterium]|nr:hypothetical protein [Vicinamibacterales bacterium]